MKTFSFLNSYRQHTYALLATGVLLFLLIYTVSIKRTLNLRGEYVLAKEKIALANNANQQINTYNQKLAALNSGGLQPYNRPLLLEEVTSFCKAEGLLIRSFPQAEEKEEENYTIITDKIEVEGTYKGMVQLVHMLEQEERLGSVSSLNFYKYKDRERRREVLRCSIVLRSLSG